MGLVGTPLQVLNRHFRMLLILTPSGKYTISMTEELKLLLFQQFVLEKTLELAGIVASSAQSNTQRAIRIVNALKNSTCLEALP